MMLGDYVMCGKGKWKNIQFVCNSEDGWRLRFYQGTQAWHQCKFGTGKAEITVVKTAAHRGFCDDGQSGRSIKLENIALFRTIAEHYSDWKYPGDS